MFKGSSSFRHSQNNAARTPLHLSALFSPAVVLLSGTPSQRGTPGQAQAYFIITGLSLIALAQSCVPIPEQSP